MAKTGNYGVSRFSVFYWTGITIAVTQGSGMHQRSQLLVLLEAKLRFYSVEVPQLSSRQALVETNLVDIIETS